MARGLSALWLSLVLPGIVLFWRYSLLAGASAAAPNSWPSNLALPHTAHQPTLIMVVHPNCPCSLASMTELQAIAEHCPGEATIDILFAQPAGLVEQVESTQLWQRARKIPDAFVLLDKGGALSRHLDARTSGQVFLYDSNGTLCFSGGITESRGHAGDNVGRHAVEEILHGHATTAATTPVFGCGLW